ncbi:MAG: sigma-54 dependent transcriptional regulator [Planctomycetaceae bacterium]|nr:sigma-54 dependent transcriptional regulator [Planctomycetaceae bacterium]
MKLLLACNERNSQTALAEKLQRLGLAVVPCADGKEVLHALQAEKFDIVLFDLDMSGVCGLTVLEHAKAFGNDADLIVLSSEETRDDSKRADGITQKIIKPCENADLEKVILRIAENRNAKKKYNALITQFNQASEDRKLTGRSDAMQRVYRLIDKIAPTESTVVILGETGTGKELAAKAIHDKSRRAAKPFIAVNCGALPEALIESELFGHRKGSFTGADANRTGLFEVANGGTLFLDEIGELPKGVQAKLLRFLESGEVRKIGDNTASVCDVRVVCATLRKLESMVQSGEFREDLWFRINTFEIHLPPLKDRKEDLPELILVLAKRFRNDLTATEAATLFTPEAYRLLLDYDYPGNVRQLANAMEHALVLSDRFPIGAEDLPDIFRQDSGSVNQSLPQRMEEPRAEGKANRPVVRKELPNFELPTSESAKSESGIAYRNSAQELMSFDPSPEAATLRDLEMKAIESALHRHGGNKSKAAEELGISLKTLYNKLNQLDKRIA